MPPNRNQKPKKKKSSGCEYQHFKSIVDIKQSNKKYQFLLLFNDGTQKWFPKNVLPKDQNTLTELEDLEKEFLNRKKLNDFNRRFNYKANPQRKLFGYENGSPLVDILGAIELNGLPVLEVTFKDSEESDLVLWDEVRRKDPQKLLNFYLFKLTLKESCKCRLEDASYGEIRPE